MKLNTLILTGAAAVTLGAFAVPANAETIYSSTAPQATVTTEGSKVVTTNYTAVGTRKVGMVGYRAYPLRASQVESSTVSTTAPTTNVVYTGNAVNMPVVGTDVSSSTTTTTSASDAPINYSTGGGTYYTQSNTKAYSDPALNIKVRHLGSFND